MACICKPTFRSDRSIIHSKECDDYNRATALRDIEWNHQDHACTGSGYAHKPHGKCPGYATDRT